MKRDPVPESSLIPIGLAARFAGLSHDGLSSLLFAEPGDTPPVRSAVVKGEEMVDVRDLGLSRPAAPRRKGVRR